MSLDIYLNCKCCGNLCYKANVTHNLGRMASEAGIYNCLWRAPENNYTKAEQLINPLKAGIEKMEKNPERFKQFNPENGWGDYEGFLRWLKELLCQCEEYPDCKIDTSR
jgi:hypothetical protein